MFIRSGVATEPFTVTREAILAGCFRELRKSSDRSELTETFCCGPARVGVLRFKASQVPTLEKSVSSTKDGPDNQQQGHEPYQESQLNLSARGLWHGTGRGNWSSFEERVSRAETSTFSHSSSVAPHRVPHRMKRTAKRIANATRVTMETWRTIAFGHHRTTVS